MSFEDSCDVSISDIAEPLTSVPLPSQETFSVDLSLSELSVPDLLPTSSQPFSLLAPRRSLSPDGSGSEEEHQHVHNVANTKEREGKLQNDLAVLRNINNSFALFNDALKETQLSNRRVNLQLKNADALVNKYIDILSESEETLRLILDERWQGADDDERIIDEEKALEKERAIREAQERLLAEQLEIERQEEEEREKKKVQKKEKGKKVVRDAPRVGRGSGAVSRGGPSTRGKARPK